MEFGNLVSCEKNKLDFIIGKKNKIDINLVERGLSRSSKKTYLQKMNFQLESSQILAQNLWT